MKPLRLYFAKAGTKTCVSTRNGTGELKSRVTCKFANEKDFTAAAKQLGVPVEVLKNAIDKFEKDQQAEFDLSVRESTIYMRGMREEASTALSFHSDTLIGALQDAIDASETGLVEPVLYWNEITELAALDLDAKPGYEFDNTKLLTLEGIPTPAFSWVTKSGGLRLVYLPAGSLNAEEIAAVAYLCLRQLTPYHALEIKNETRHPKYTTAAGESCGEVYRREQMFDSSYLRRWLKLYAAADDEVQRWLAERSLVIGQRYDHERCPVDPGHVSRGTTPVLVGDKGIKCFSCEARGIAKGGPPGFFPYTVLCSTTAASMAYRCMSCATHWEHAKFVIESKLDITGRYAELIYAAGLVLFGWDRTVINRAFASGKNFVRMNDRWTNLNGETYSKDIRPLLATLPACNTIIGDKMVPDRAKVVSFDQSFDLAESGYPSVQPVYGLCIRNQFIPPGERDLTAVIQVRELSDSSMIKFRPAYRAPEKRLADPWAVIEEVFPGVDRKYLKLLIAARGVIEGNCSMTPMIFATGPTGSGKSISATLAACICGDKNTEIVWTANTDRLRQAIVDARGSFVTFNEVLKESQRQQRSSTSSMDFILNLTPDSVSHYMYAGPVRMGRLPVLVWTDTDLSINLKQDAQLARRLVHVPLTAQVDWESALKRTGVGDPSNFRLFSEVNAEASNAVVSEVIDEFFREPLTFEDIAKELGFGRLSRSEEAEDARSELVRFFNLVSQAPELPPEDAVRFKGRGWKLIRRDLQCELLNLWLTICDKDGPNDVFVSSRRCSEQDWQKLLDAAEALNFEIRAHGTAKVVVRFRSVAGTRVDYRVNQELLRKGAL